MMKATKTKQPAQYSSPILGAGAEWARLMQALDDSTTDGGQRYFNEYFWQRVEAAERTALTTRATAAAEAAVQAHLLMAGIEALNTTAEHDSLAEREFRDARQRLEMAAQSLRIFLAKLAGDSQPEAFQENGIGAALEHKFEEGRPCNI
jgi:hypothetical protein